MTIVAKTSSDPSSTRNRLVEPFLWNKRIITRLCTDSLWANAVFAPFEIVARIALFFIFLLPSILTLIPFLIGRESTPQKQQEPSVETHPLLGTNAPSNPSTSTASDVEGTLTRRKPVTKLQQPLSAAVPTAAARVLPITAVPSPTISSFSQALNPAAASFSPAARIPVAVSASTSSTPLNKTVIPSTTSAPLKALNPSAASFSPVVRPPVITTTSVSSTPSHKMVTPPRSDSTTPTSTPSSNHSSPNRASIISTSSSSSSSPVSFASNDARSCSATPFPQPASPAKAGTPALSISSSSSSSASSISLNSPAKSSLKGPMHPNFDGKSFTFKGKSFPFDKHGVAVQLNDGNCWLHSVIFGLNLQLIDHTAADEDHLQLRSKVVEWMRANYETDPVLKELIQEAIETDRDVKLRGRKADLLNLKEYYAEQSDVKLTEKMSKDVVLNKWELARLQQKIEVDQKLIEAVSNLTVDEYLSHIKKPKAFAGGAELYALSRIFKINIQVWRDFPAHKHIPRQLIPDAPIVYHSQSKVDSVNIVLNEKGNHFNYRLPEDLAK